MGGSWRTLTLLILAGSAAACSREAQFLGFDVRSRQEVVSPGVGADADAGPEPEPAAPAQEDDDVSEAPGGNGGSPSGGGSGPVGGGGEGSSGGGSSLGGAPGTGGRDEPPKGVDAGEGSGGAFEGPTADREPPNHLVDVLGEPPAAVARRIEEAFQQLFHGDPVTESIFIELEDGSAYLYDVYHGDTRADALGNGLLVTVWLDKKEEFDALWAYTKERLQYRDGPRAGYFRRFCGDPLAEMCDDDVGVFGGFNIVTALLLAEARWGNGSDLFDYGTEARAVLDAYRMKETENRGIVDGVINQFTDEGLPVRTPDEAHGDQASAEILMPGYFQYWGEKTGEEFWAQAATRSREMIRDMVNPENGLSPSVAYFDGSPVEGEGDFKEGSYEVALNLAIDTAWYGEDPDQVMIANRLIGFFASFGGSYPALYTYEGDPLVPHVSFALAAFNGCAAGISTIPPRIGFIRSVWDTPIQAGAFRYFDGINQLLSLMYLGGYTRPY